MRRRTRLRLTTSADAQFCSPAKAGTKLAQNPAYRFALINNKLKFEYFANDKPMNANHLFANIFLTFAIIRIYEEIRTAF